MKEEEKRNNSRNNLLQDFSIEQTRKRMGEEDSKYDKYYIILMLQLQPLLKTVLKQAQDYGYHNVDFIVTEEMLQMNRFILEYEEMKKKLNECHRKLIKQ